MGWVYLPTFTKDEIIKKAEEEAARIMEQAVQDRKPVAGGWPWPFAKGPATCKLQILWHLFRVLRARHSCSPVLCLLLKTLGIGVRGAADLCGFPKWLLPSRVQMLCQEERIRGDRISRLFHPNIPHL